MTATLYEPFSLSVVPDRSQVAVVPAGELDLTCARELEDEVQRLLDLGFDRVVVDLRPVTFIDSSGLRALITLQANADRDGHRLELVPGPWQVRRIFDLTGTRRLFTWRGHY